MAGSPEDENGSGGMSSALGGIMQGVVNSTRMNPMESLFGKVLDTDGESSSLEANGEKEEETTVDKEKSPSADTKKEIAADRSSQNESDTPKKVDAAKEDSNGSKTRGAAEDDEDEYQISDRLSTASSEIQIMKAAATKFNIKPKDGIKFLLEKGLLQKNAAAVAQYLHEHAGNLSKKRIGEYLGNIEEFNQSVLSEFLKAYNFEGKTLVQSLRMILTEFRLPGEAQQIDRILEKFSAQFFRTQTEGFSNEDTVYILSFSIIMLNTDRHNPNISESKKMTLEGFISNNRGINDGKDMEREVLERLFHDINENEIRMNEGDQWEGDVVTFMAPNKSGWLHKQNHGTTFGGKWKKHWFVLSEHVLYYFDSPGDEKPRLILPMDSVRVGRDTENDRLLQIVNADGFSTLKCTKCLDNGRMELQTYKDFVMRAANQEERDEWYEVLRDDVEPDPVQRMQRERQRLQRMKQRERAAKADAALQREKGTGKDSGRLQGRGLLELPPPVAKGWMTKRGESNSSWRRRYFALIDPPEEMNLGAALYYFTSEALCTRMLEIGEQTQKGQLFLEHVKKVSVGTDAKDKTAIIMLVCKDRNWKVRPETPEAFHYWMQTLEKYVQKEKRRLENRAAAAAAASIETISSVAAELSDEDE